MPADSWCSGHAGEGLELRSIRHPDDVKALIILILTEVKALIICILVLRARVAVAVLAKAAATCIVVHNEASRSVAGPPTAARTVKYSMLVDARLRARMTASAHTYVHTRMQVMNRKLYALHISAGASTYIHTYVHA